ncbi:GGDEF domain-containing protein [Schlegelella sp. S2-27]|uniref:diguanylate cyclase n=1 Tax=Caldimonas mangrovi TaxID=2944811 RepID=A0ABT0YVX2_9BURK|nr:diguanylate cyclase [Caldimonas mangrovi]MCM5682890.1 GGDEF domain-containing protein [Caldimonas mangrovi]
MRRLPKPKESLGVQLVLAILGFCLVFTVLTVAVRTWWAWQAGVAAMSAELTLIEQVYRRTLSKAIWEMDRESLETHLASAAKVPSVGRVALTITPAHRAPEVIDRRQEGWVASGVAPARRLVLAYEPFPGSSETLGELLLFGDERVLWSRLGEEVSAIVTTQIIQSLLLASLILLVFRRSVTVHVRRIANHLGQLTPVTLGQRLSLDRPGHRDDELSLLVAGVNQLQDNLSDYLEQQQRYESELAQHRDRLADLVRERTAELEALAAAQQLVLTLSNRLIHAPYDAFDKHLLGCLREVAQRLGATMAAWYVRDDATGGYALYLHWQAAGAVPSSHLQRVAADDWQQLQAVLDRDELVDTPSRAALAQTIGAGEAARVADWGIEAAAFTELRGGDEHFGLLMFGKPQAVVAWQPDERALLAMTAQMLVHSVRHKTQLIDIVQGQQALRAVNAQLAELARSDALTGLANRRHFDEAKELEFRRGQRLQQPLSLLVCDIDHFKLYNDTYGHARGDECLLAVAEAIRSSVRRAGDLVARIGGKEFAILLSATDEAAALALAERILGSVRDAAIAHAGSDEGPFVTLSIGLAVSTSQRANDFDALFRAADAALYRAKAGGRNRVVAAAPVASEAALDPHQPSDKEEMR